MVRPRRETIVALGVTLLYAALALYRSLHHVMWADEWAVWLTGKMSATNWDVVRTVRYDGHPPIWYLILHGLSRIWPMPGIAAGVHALVASCSVFLIWRYGPFSLVEKILLPLGYFFFFEYSTITRSYAPAVMLALAAAALWPQASRRPVLYAALLLLIGQWSVYGMILSLTLAATVAARWWSEGAPAGWKWAAAVMAVSLVMFYLSMRPPADAVGRELWMNDWRQLSPGKALASWFDAYVPLPKMQKHWWNSQMLPLPDAARGAIGILIFAALAWSMQTRAARVAMIAGSAAVLAMVLLVYTGSMRHWGHWFIVLVLAVWIERVTLGQRGARLGNFLFMSILVVQAVGGVMAAMMDLRQPFSASPEAAVVIRSVGNDLPILGDFDYEMSPLAGELDRPIWLIRSDQARWFVRYDQRRKRNVTIKMIEDQSRELAEKEKSDVLLVMTYAAPIPDYFERVAEVAPETVGDEGYWIYRYRRNSAQSGQLVVPRRSTVLTAGEQGG
jgi:hypothetical protein